MVHCEDCTWYRIKLHDREEIPDRWCHMFHASTYKDDTAWIILWVTAHNMMLYATTTMPMVVLK